MRELFRIFVDKEINIQDSLPIVGKQAHYLLHVLRLKVKDCLLVFNDRQGEWQAEIEDIKKNEVILKIQQVTRLRSDTPSLNLLFSPLKSGPLSFLLEKATELGVTNLYPLWFNRTQGREFKVDRLKTILQEAAEQCGRLTLPTLHSPVSLENFLSIWSRENSLFVCDERRNAVPLWDILHQLSVQDHPRSIMIGPEGGFTPTEFEMLSESSAVHFVSLGSTILRAETAGIHALSVLISQLYSYQRSQS